jgi:hypothetical protein
MRVFLILGGKMIHSNFNMVTAFLMTARMHLPPGESSSRAQGYCVEQGEEI